MEKHLKKAGAMKKSTAVLLPSGAEANLDALRRACDALDIPFGSPHEIIDAIRSHVAKIIAADPDSIAECDICGEQSTLETDFCPFCGDAGTEQVTEAAPTQHPTTAKLQAGHEARVAQADEAARRINQYEKDYTKTMYELGEELNRVREEKLWSAHGAASFRKWVQERTNVSIRYADQIADIAKKFTKEQYIQLGTAKLNFALRIKDEDLRAEILAEASEKNLTLVEMREAAAPALPPRKKAPMADAPLPAPPPEEPKKLKAPKSKKQISLLARVDDAPKSYHFIDPESGAKLPAYEIGSGAYLEIPISADVVLRATPVHNTKGQLVKIKAMFTRVVSSDAEEAAE